MISAPDQKRILSLTEKFWVSEVKKQSFLSIFSGKEIGHRIADYVDESTTDHLIQHVETAHEIGRTGKRRSRSMGDIWIKSSGIYNPLNVKAGEYGKDGQPNLVSINKVLSALLNNWIDSYYLLIIKMDVVNASVQTNDKVVTPKIFLVDMLDHLDVLAYDSGPGQLMLKEKKFYEKMEQSSSTYDLSLAEKIESLIEVKMDGDERLARNRLKTSEKLKKMAIAYRKKGSVMIDQGGLHLGSGQS